MQFCKNPIHRNKSHLNLWICSRHFEKSMYANGLLNRYAIPTLNAPTNYDKKLDEDDLDDDMPLASRSAAKSKSKDKPESKQKKNKPTSEVTETIVTEEEDDCESVTFSSEVRSRRNKNFNIVNRQTLFI